MFLIRCEWVIERHIERKGFEATTSEDIRTLIRLSTATLGERPGRCSPYALAEALLSLEQADSSTEALTPHDLANGLATLPAERLLPELPETMQKAFKTLVNADSAIGRSEILDRAGISEASYERNIAELAAVGLVESVGNGGHKKWRGWILPWWSPLAGKPTDSPRTSETDDDESGFSPAARVNDVLYQMALDLGLGPEYDLFATLIDLDAVFAALPDLDRWREFILAHYGLDRPAETPDRARYSLDTPPTPDHTVEMGSPPIGWDHEQTSLSAGD